MDRETTQRVMEFIGKAIQEHPEFICTENDWAFIKVHNKSSNNFNSLDLANFITEAINEKIEREKLQEFSDSQVQLDSDFAQALNNLKKKIRKEKPSKPRF